MTIRIVIADDHRIILEGLEQLLRRERDFDVVATATTGESALEAIRSHEPDVAVLDVNMPEGDGLSVLRRVRAELPRIRVVLLTATLDDDQAVDAVQSGVHGIVLKESAAVMLVDCVRRVASGARVIDPTVASRAVGRMLERSEARTLAQTLSPREREIVTMIAAGMRNKEIATRLAISEGTVKTHLHTIYRKLSVDGRVELAVYAVDHGLS
jgi:two-component system nitrate/nitrite response regulator NarL